MVKKGKSEYCCAPMESGMGCCCKVESLMSVDERGQMVLPKEIREKAGIRAGDTLALVTWEKDGEVYCISLVKIEAITEMVKGMLGPVMKEILQD